LGNGCGSAAKNSAGRLDSKVNADIIAWAIAEVTVTPEAQTQFNRLPLPIQKRVRAVFHRLYQWPQVSGAKPMRRELAGSYRIRTGDYRVVFHVTGEVVTVWKIGDRRDVYD
jgi:mRNA-degrading endonuclease RelE of RelBE toxin-antitoxin system